jgi:hypothetical protein
MNPSAFQPTPPRLQQTYADPLQHHMPASKRPKLSLQTSLPTVQTAASRVDNMATPTTRNTLANQYHSFDLSIRPSPASTTTSPAAAFPKPGPISRKKRSLPYDLNLPLGKRSILKNSSLPEDVRRGSLSAASASPRSASGARRVFFPEPKRVKFGSDEEIVTQTYTIRHVDISSSSEDETSSGSENAAGETEEADQTSEEPSTMRMASRNGDAVIVDELQRGRGSSSRSSSRRRITKKKRRWEWTLGAVESQVTNSRVEKGIAEEAQVQPEEQQKSPSEAPTSSSLSETSPATPSATETKPLPDVSVDEIVPTPTSATQEQDQPTAATEPPE